MRVFLGRTQFFYKQMLDTNQKKPVFKKHIFTQIGRSLCQMEAPAEDNTLQPLYNTVRYNTVLDIKRFKDGSQKCIDYIEK